MHPIYDLLSFSSVKKAITAATTTDNNRERGRERERTNKVKYLQWRNPDEVDREALCSAFQLFSKFKLFPHLSVHYSM